MKEKNSPRTPTLTRLNAPIDIADVNVLVRTVVNLAETVKKIIHTDWRASEKDGRMNGVSV